MTKLLEAAMEAASRLPDDQQDYVAQAVLGLLNLRSGPLPIHPDDLEAVLEGLAQAERGEFASDEEVEAIFARHRE